MLTAVCVNNTLVRYTVFLAADTLPCVLIYNIIYIVIYEFFHYNKILGYYNLHLICRFQQIFLMQSTELQDETVKVFCE